MRQVSGVLHPSWMEVNHKRGGIFMEIGVVIAVTAFIVMALTAVLVAVISAVSTVSGIKHTTDDDTAA